MEYCATDVAVTQKVFKKVWPNFVKENCRHPVTIAGILELGSTFLPVDQEWDQYIARSEECFRKASEQVRTSLVSLTERVREEGCRGLSWDEADAIASRQRALEQGVAEHLTSKGAAPFPYFHSASSAAQVEGPRAWWEDDPWLSQLDWSPKKPKKARVAAEEIDYRTVPTWYRDLVVKAPPSGLSLRSPSAAVLVQPTYEGERLDRDDAGQLVTAKHGSILGEKKKVANILSATFLKTKAGKLVSSAAGKDGEQFIELLRDGETDAAREQLATLAERALLAANAPPSNLSALDWTPVQIKESTPDAAVADEQQPWWPKWYWDLFKTATGQLEFTIRSKVSPTLLKISWRGRPLFHSRQHGWVYRVEPETTADDDFTTRQKPVEFTDVADAALKLQAGQQEHVVNSRGRETKEIIYDPTRPTFYKVPHTAGEEANVGSPFSKAFIQFFEDGILRSEHPSEEEKSAAKAALEMNAQCSYWISARDRVEKQMVVWDGHSGTKMDATSDSSNGSTQLGMILPQVITMGTVTRRAIEKTWLTASNAKKNRVGSELKSMVKAPPGWCIVGADVDSEELWICSVMGDAQFGVHGATAVGWMTLEGTKAQGTDLHSKTASILGTSRNQAKVFNYSRIYGAGIRHATQLLLKANPSMPTEEATRLAKELYAHTKGQNTHSSEYFGRKFWFGGSESYVFNKLESIAVSDQPRTPALGCGVTAALSRKFLPRKTWTDGKVGEDYMPSRINWVVQSSGVDYLHMLTAAMTYLCKNYNIQARFMLSVHDEVRYLCKEEDKYRTAMALQVANVWTRAMFAFRLDFDDLPQGCAFFSQVDIDSILRKEVDDACVTPSHPDPVPAGEALTIEELLEKTRNGDLGASHSHPAQGREAFPYMQHELMDLSYPPFEHDHQIHRSDGLLFLQAQAASDINEIRSLDRKASEAKSQSGLLRTNAKTFRRPSRAVAARAYSTTSAQTAAELLELLPRAVPRQRVSFVKTDIHRQTVFSLYRRLLRHCPPELRHLRQSIRRDVRQNRSNTGPAPVYTLLKDAERVGLHISFHSSAIADSSSNSTANRHVLASQRW